MEKLSGEDLTRRLVDVLVVVSPSNRYVPGFLTQGDIERINKAGGFPSFKESVDLIIETKHGPLLEGEMIDDLLVAIAKSK